MTVCVQTLQPRISMEDYDTSDVELASTSLAAGADSMRKRLQNSKGKLWFGVPGSRRLPCC